MIDSIAVFETIARLRTMVIRHPQFDFAYNALIKSYEMNRLVGIPQNHLFVGDSGTGKTTIKKNVASAFPERMERDRKVIPVLIIDTPSLPTVKNLAEELLIKLGDPRFARGSAIEKTARILRYLEASEVKLLIIDELQHFLDQGNRKTPREVSDWLKSLIERANVSTVLMGLERSEKILEVNEQLRRRFSQRLELRPFDLASVPDRAIFIGVLKKLEEAINLPSRMDLQQQELVRSIHYATNGIIDYMVKLLIGAFEAAIELDCDSINTKCLAFAFRERIWPQANEELNPFNKKFIVQRLDKKGMPFYKGSLV